MNNYVFYGDNVDKTLLQKLNIVISPTSLIGKNVKIFYNTCVLGASVLCDDVVIYNNSTIDNSVVGVGSAVFSSKIQNSSIGKDCVIGPFSVISKTKLGNNVRVANFAEVDTSRVDDNATIKSLAIVEGATIGQGKTVDSGKTVSL